ncbi:MAG TPA: hypothetical protein VMG82_11425 [Candidatus Sulfotelmatobacter sp.]|nr:hypothetical protein [Candidatus Sulfotelmatobacter sp.]
MKAFRTFFFAGLLALTAGAIGQTNPGVLVVDVPFAFSAQGQKFPAGHYIVSQKDDMILIFNHKQGRYVPTHLALRTKADGSKLVFHRYGDEYFLQSVWITGNTSGKELYPSRAEHELKAKHAEMEMAVVRPAQ